jgi:hypothetical protein
MFRNDAPLLFRPQLPFGEGWQQWRWGLQFLAQCNDAAFERNVQQLVALGAYSHAALKDVVAATGIEYNRLERGIAHYYTDQKTFDTAGEAAALMRKYGVARRVVSTRRTAGHRAGLPPSRTASSAAPTPPATKAATPASSPRRWRSAAPTGARVSCSATTSNGSKRPAARSSPSPCDPRTGGNE